MDPRCKFIVLPPFIKLRFQKAVSFEFVDRIFWRSTKLLSEGFIFVFEFVPSTTFLIWCRRPGLRVITLHKLAKKSRSVRLACSVDVNNWTSLKRANLAFDL